jgi:hypothetical protein
LSVPLLLHIHSCVIRGIGGGLVIGRSSETSLTQLQR